MPRVHSSYCCSSSSIKVTSLYEQRLCFSTGIGNNDGAESLMAKRGAEQSMLVAMWQVGTPGKQIRTLSRTTDYSAAIRGDDKVLSGVRIPPCSVVRF